MFITGFDSVSLSTANISGSLVYNAHKCNFNFDFQWIKKNLFLVLASYIYIFSLLHKFLAVCSSIVIHVTEFGGGMIYFM